MAISAASFFVIGFPLLLLFAFKISSILAPATSNVVNLQASFVRNPPVAQNNGNRKNMPSHSRVLSFPNTRDFSGGSVSAKNMQILKPAMKSFAAIPSVSGSADHPPGDEAKSSRLGKNEEELIFTEFLLLETNVMKAGKLVTFHQGSDHTVTKYRFNQEQLREICKRENLELFDTIVRNGKETSGSLLEMFLPRTEEYIKFCKNFNELEKVNRESLSEDLLMNVLLPEVPEKVNIVREVVLQNIDISKAPRKL